MHHTGVAYGLADSIVAKEWRVSANRGHAIA